MNPPLPLLLLPGIQDGVKRHDGALVLQQRHVHDALQILEGSVPNPVLHDVGRFPSPEHFDGGELGLRGGVEEPQDGEALLGGVQRVQRGGVRDDLGGTSGFCGLVEVRVGQRDAAPPAGGALQEARRGLGRAAARRRAASWTRRGDLNTNVRTRRDGFRSQPGP